ncbi:MAG: hypothetical protein H0W99_01760 [Acidobacteria bacterium]|nr:hypothetical protein [Acidobacteriota bacterium]
MNKKRRWEQATGETLRERVSSSCSFSASPHRRASMSLSSSLIAHHSSLIFYGST